MPKFLNFHEFCKELPEITSVKIIDKKKFHSEGLFSEQIFGPLNNYTCQCGIYYGSSKDGYLCPECNVQVVNSDERRRRFAKIILPIPVVNPLFYDMLVDIGDGDLKDILDEIMKSDVSIMYKDKDVYYVTEQGKQPEGVETWERLDAIYEVVSNISNKLAEKGIEEWKIVNKNLDNLIIDQIIVLPPDLRPAAKGIERNNQVLDQINRYYAQILHKKESMKDTIIDIEKDKKLYYSYYRQIQKDVSELYKHILEKLSKKEGLIRGNILGKRIDFSGRAVIVPDPTLDLDSCVLPYLMFLELFKLQVSKRLIYKGKFKLLNNAIDFVDKCIELKTTSLFRICEEIAKDEVCILNRQPSLHRLSMIGFNIKISLDEVIKIHPLVCPGFNADFDGDQMAVYVPITEVTKQEVKDKLLMSKNLNNPSDNSLSTTPSQDIILGLYSLSANLFPDLLEIVEFKGRKITESRKIVNECFPDDYPIVDEELKKLNIIKILNDIKDRYPESVIKEVLDKTKLVGFKYSTLFGSTMALNECYLKDADKYKQIIYSEQTISQQLNRVSSNETKDLMKKNFNYAYTVESGARGSWDQVRQIILTRGFISNFKGQILPVPIKHSLIDGLNQEEFFLSTYGCRKGLLDVALNTGISGYLSRKLIFTCSNLQLDENLKDCGTTDTLSIFVKDEKKAKMLIGRWFVINNNLILITKANYESFVGQTLNLRSPILCKSPKVCTTCYGDLYKSLHSKFVGVISAQSLGECNTQLVLRTFHTSGVASVKDKINNKDMIQQDIIGDLSSVSKMLHNFQGKNYTDLVSKLFEVYNNSRKIHHVHFEVLVAQLMWNNLHKWRLLEDRDKKEIQFYSVQTVPAKESWLLGLAFSNPKKNILSGILYPGNYTGVMDKILCGEKI